MKRWLIMQNAIMNWRLSIKKLKPLLLRSHKSLLSTISLSSLKQNLSLWSVVLMLLLPACSMISPLPVGEQKAPNLNKLVPPIKPQPILVRPVEWVVIKFGDEGLGMACLDGKNYENLAYNIADFARFIQQQNARTTFFENQH